MDGFEDKISSILASPEAMGKVMDIARSLSGGEREEKPAEESESEPASGIGSLLGGIDPAMITKFMPILRAYGEKPSGKQHELLKALKPYLRKERRDRVDRAANIVKLARTARTALDSFGKER